MSLSLDLPNIIRGADYLVDPISQIEANSENISNLTNGTVNQTLDFLQDLRTLF